MKNIYNCLFAIESNIVGIPLFRTLPSIIRSKGSSILCVKMTTMLLTYNAHRFR